MPAEINMVVSATEFPQFRRLVEFVGEVYNHAEAVDDQTLLEIIGNVRDDLFGMALGD